MQRVVYAKDGCINTLEADSLLIVRSQHKLVKNGVARASMVRVVKDGEGIECAQIFLDGTERQVFDLSLVSGYEALSIHVSYSDIIQVVKSLAGAMRDIANVASMTAYGEPEEPISIDVPLCGVVMSVETDEAIVSIKGNSTPQLWIDPVFLADLAALLDELVEGISS